MSTATPIPTTAAVTAAAASPNFAAVGTIAPRSLMNAPTLGAVCAASPMLLIAFPIGCKVVAIFFAFPRSPVAPLAISIELSTEERPAFFPPGRIADALENNVPRPEEIRCFPSPLIQSAKG